MLTANFKLHPNMHDLVAAKGALKHTKETELRYGAIAPGLILSLWLACFQETAVALCRRRWYSFTPRLRMIATHNRT
jgi:hypothetical protein